MASSDVFEDRKRKSDCPAPRCEAWSPGETEFCVLCTFWSGRCPLTRGELQARTGLSAETISNAVAKLQASGHLTRLAADSDRYILAGSRTG